MQSSEKTFKKEKKMSFPFECTGIHWALAEYVTKKKLALLHLHPYLIDKPKPNNYFMSFFLISNLQNGD